jgi:arylsulfatase A-like enzyme
VDVSLGRIVTELTNKGLLDSTLIVISAKHGQSPIDIGNLHMETGGKGTADVTDPHGAVNAIAPTVDVTLSTFTNPNSGSGYAINGHLMTDDVGILWLQDQTKTATAVTALQTAATAIHADTLPAGTVFSTNITSGAALAAIFGDPTVTSDPVASARAPTHSSNPTSASSTPPVRRKSPSMVAARKTIRAWRSSSRSPHLAQQKPSRPPSQPRRSPRRSYRRSASPRRSCRLS